MVATAPTGATEPEPGFDLVDWVMRYEAGEMQMAEAITGFQYLVDSGLAWSLQGSYGRMARYLMDEGLVTRPEERYAREVAR
jgi:hypothetical protein